MVEEIYRTRFTLKHGVADYLRWLKENGTPMCIATVTDRYLVEETLEHLGTPREETFVFEDSLYHRYSKGYYGQKCKISSQRC